MFLYLMAIFISSISQRDGQSITGPHTKTDTVIFSLRSMGNLSLVQTMSKSYFCAFPITFSKCEWQKNMVNVFAGKKVVFL